MNEKTDLPLIYGGLFQDDYEKYYLSQKKY